MADRNRSTDMLTVRPCKKCGESLPADAAAQRRVCGPCKTDYKRDFARHWRKKNRAREQAYGRANWLSRGHGLTEADLAALLAAQADRCAICGTDSPSGRGWHIDHVHDRGCHPGRGSCEGCRRGVLCAACNQAIGLFGDAPDVAAAAAAYLRRWDGHG